MLYIKDNVEREAASKAEEERLKLAGFKPLHGSEQDTAPDEASSQNLDDMNVSELKTLAKERGINGASSLSKAELLEVLKDVV